MKPKFVLNLISIFLCSIHLTIGIPAYSSEESIEVKRNSLSLLNSDYLKQQPNNFYILGPGDSLKIIISRDYPELNTKAIINGEGYVFVPKLNKIYVAGLTIVELTELLNKAYKEYVKYPDIEIEIENYRIIKVSIEGEVNNPGLYKLSGAMNTGIIKEGVQEDTILFEAFPTIFDVIRKSGGINISSDLSKIKIVRKNSISGGGGKIMTSVDLEDSILKGDFSNNIRIYDGDIITIPTSNNPKKELFSKANKTNINPKFLQVLVTGRVNFPGMIKASKLNTLNDAIDIAGGAKVIRGKVRYLSFNSDGSVISRNIKYRKSRKRGSYSNPFLKDGDLIIVGNSLLGLTSEVLGEITAPLNGIITTYALVEALNN